MTGFQRLIRPDPIVCADVMLNVSFDRRDIDPMHRFLEDFGLLAYAPSGNTRYYRGAGTSPHLVSVRQSDRDGFTAFALAARTLKDLHTLANVTGARVEPAEGPGGGIRVRLVDPDGLTVDLVHGFEGATPLAGCDALQSVNTPNRKTRVNVGVRPPLIPSPLFKLGHVVLERPDFDRASHWYMRHFGLIPTDVQCLPDGRPALGFLRLDRGAQPADHHSLAILGGPGSKLLHVSFETLDLDAVGQGNQYLRARGWTHHWGIGRHVLGSQIFDYWKDPAGDEWEHYADGDVMTADYPTGYRSLTRGELWSWGDDLPESMRPAVPLEDVEAVYAAGGFGDIEVSRVKGLLEALNVPPRPWLR
jgi:hypothetical protein